jgi:hypothetical protein
MPSLRCQKKAFNGLDFAVIINLCGGIGGRPVANRTDWRLDIVFYFVHTCLVIGLGFVLFVITHLAPPFPLAFPLASVPRFTAITNGSHKSALLLAAASQLRLIAGGSFTTLTAVSQRGQVWTIRLYG